MPVATKKVLVTPANAVVIVTSEKGQPGASGTDFVYVQAAAAAVWTIVHNLGFYPNVTVIDSGGSEVEGDLVYLSANQIRLTFSAAFSGTAYLT